MTAGAFVIIPADQYNQLWQAMEQVNKDLHAGGATFSERCAIAPGEMIIETGKPAMQRVNILFPSIQVVFSLARTFGIILEKVNPQSL